MTEPESTEPVLRLTEPLLPLVRELGGVVELPLFEARRLGWREGITVTIEVVDGGTTYRYVEVPTELGPGGRVSAFFGPDHFAGSWSVPP